MRSLRRWSSPDEASQRGEIAAWVLVTLMTAGLVVSVWGLAHDRLLDIVSSALSNVCGSVGC